MFEYSKLYIKYIMFNKFKKLVDKGEMLWYSNIAVGESGALQELQKFLKINNHAASSMILIYAAAAKCTYGYVRLARCLRK